MIRYFKGTVFNVKADAMVNTVNTVGVMGAGLALEMALRYPEFLEDYKMKCEKNLIRIGKVDYYLGQDVKIINFPTKQHFKYPSRIEWIEAGLRDFVLTYKDKNIKSVAFPKLGSLNGGLDWIKVRGLMEKYLFDLDILVYICLDVEKEPEGIEYKMVQNFNSISIDSLRENVKLNQKQIEVLKTCKPIKRFFSISKMEGIGQKTYSSLFNYFYNQSKSQ